MATNHAAPEKMLLDRTDGSSTMELYRAALGPLRTDYYLKAFTRFDAAGRSRPSWNWEAALLTLNWLAFRRLWGAALAYCGVLVFATLLMLGIGRLVLQLQGGALWGLLAAVVLAAVVVPGFLGNGWLYAATNQRIENALDDSATLEDSLALLRQRAPGMRRLGWLGGLNLVLFAAVAAIVQALPDSQTLPLGSDKMNQARNATVDESQGAAGKPPVAAALQPQEAASAPASAASMASRMSQGAVQIANLAPPESAPASQPSAPASAPSPAASAPASAQAAAPAAPTPPASEPAAQKPATAGHKHKTPKAEKADKSEKKSHKAKPPADTASTHKTSAKKAAADAKPAAPVAAADTYLINVGLFADENNARNAYTRLKDAGLPATSQEVKSSKGPRIRVRVGPYETQAEADRAAETIRGLRLEAQVFKP